MLNTFKKYSVVRTALITLLASMPFMAAAQDFNPRDFNGDWMRESAIVTYSNVPESSRSPDNLPIPSTEPSFEAPFTELGREIYLSNKPSYGPNMLSFERNDPILRCEPMGIPRNLTAEIIEPHDTFEIIQLTDRIVQFFEYRHDWREIWMDGRELPAFEDTFPKWNGYSVGRFEGDTLVIESIGFDDRTWLDKFGYPHSEEMHLIERYRRINADTLELTMTVTDPIMYTEAWQSDTKIFSLDRERASEWDEQIYCIPADEFQP